jgi:pimeloyl-ACP methyl ester carboxylesterase
MFYHDLDAKDTEYWFHKLRPHSVATFREKPTSPAWLNIPSAYLVCEDDRSIPAENQDAMVEGARQAGGVIEVERVFCGHSPHLTKPDKVADFLRRAAGETF